MEPRPEIYFEVSWTENSLTNHVKDFTFIT